MIIKETDSKNATIAKLEQLIAIAPSDLKPRIEQELRAVRVGVKGEAEAAYLIDFDLKNSEHIAIIHDLRLEIDGRVAQIDHVLLHKTLTVFAVETKSFHAGIKITEEGEFLQWNDYKGKFEGIPSPLAQNERHISVLRDAFKLIEMPTRFGATLLPTFESIVVISPKTRIDRPKHFDTSRVVKADMLLQALEKTLDKKGFLDVIGATCKLVSSKLLEEIGHKLIALHKPASVNFAAKFGLSNATSEHASSLIAPVVIDETKTVIPNLIILQAKTTIATPSTSKCGKCNSEKIFVQSGKYGFYFKCRNCNNNISIKVNCNIDGHKEHIRQDGRTFYRECEACKTSSVFFVNAK